MSPRPAAKETPLTGLIATMDRVSHNLLITSTQALEAVAQAAGTAGALRKLSALADAWDAEAGQVAPHSATPGLPRIESPVALTLQMCARQLRKAAGLGDGH